MPLFNEDEKGLLSEALGLYAQLVQQRAPREQAARVVELAQALLDKIETAEAGGGDSPSKKPRGISDEWFAKCCLACPQLAPGGRCLDKITEKFPGKCDPIILYERAKPVKK